MARSSSASAPRHDRALPVAGGRAPADLRDEALFLRKILLELRGDLPAERGAGRESNRARFAEALASLANLAVSSEEVEPVLGAACEMVVETLGVDGAVVLVPAAAGRLAVRAAAGCVAGARGEELEAGDEALAGLALSQAGSTSTADGRATWPRDPFLASHALAGAALAPLPGAAGPRGLLGAFTQRRRTFAPDEVRFLEAAAASLSAAVERARADAERLELQARLAIADRMVSVGALAAGVAHELNNPLAYVNANLSFVVEEVTRLAGRLAGLDAEPPEDGELAGLLDQIVSAARDARDGGARMKAIVGDLKTLSRADDGRAGPVEVGPVIESCVNVAWSELKHRARLERDLPPVPAVLGNEARLGQVLLNLLVNAAQAIPAGPPDRNSVRVATRALPGDRVAIEVSDTGCGIPREDQERIFEPFFTTKPAGIGTGLGLSICRSIVGGMGGAIEVESEVGRGSTFRVILPAALEPDPEPRPRGAPEADRGAPGRSIRRSRILVVDDEPLVGAVLERTIGEQHEVVTAAGGREALGRIARGETFDLILCDLLMPGLSGMELHRELSRTDPALAGRIVFLTGGAFTASAREFIAQPGREWLEKPFDLESIRALLARRLGPT